MNDVRPNWMISNADKRKTFGKNCISKKSATFRIFDLSQKTHHRAILLFSPHCKMSLFCWETIFYRHFFFFVKDLHLFFVFEIFTFDFVPCIPWFGIRLTACCHVRFYFWCNLVHFYFGSNKKDVGLLVIVNVVVFIKKFCSRLGSSFITGLNRMWQLSFCDSPRGEKHGHLFAPNWIDKSFNL